MYIYLHGNARSAWGHVICRVKEHFVGSGFWAAAIKINLQYIMGRYWFIKRIEISNLYITRVRIIYCKKGVQWGLTAAYFGDEIVLSYGILNIYFVYCRTPTFYGAFGILFNLFSKFIVILIAIIIAGTFRFIELGRISFKIKHTTLELQTRNSASVFS